MRVYDFFFFFLTRKADVSQSTNRDIRVGRLCVCSARGKRENISHRDDSGQEPLELHERRAPGVDRQRAQRHSVHAVRRRRPRELHRSGYV